MHGGLFVDCCTACGWNSAGTYSPTIVGMPRSPVHRLTVRWKGGTLKAKALKVLREHSKSAMRMGMTELMDALDDGISFDLGLVSESTRIQLSPSLEQAGFIVTTELTC